MSGKPATEDWGASSACVPRVLGDCCLVEGPGLPPWHEVVNESVRLIGSKVVGLQDTAPGSRVNLAQGAVSQSTFLIVCPNPSLSPFDLMPNTVLQQAFSSMGRPPIPFLFWETNAQVPSAVPAKAYGNCTLQSNVSPLMQAVNVGSHFEALCQRPVWPTHFSGAGRLCMLSWHQYRSGTMYDELLHAATAWRPQYWLCSFSRQPPKRVPT